MQICRIDPLSDPRWPRLVERHPQGGIFHSTSWLEALRRTYGYTPVAYTLAGADGEFVSGIPFCRIDSFITGRRLVSLPFSDHCQPLIESSEHLQPLLSAVHDDVARYRMKYFELRPLELDYSQLGPVSLAQSGEALLHRLNLLRPREEIIASFHKSNVLRKIRNERQDLQLEEGKTETLLSKFYSLMVLTRRRHQLPPQPRSWFRNLIQCAGRYLTIRVLSKDGVSFASIMTFSFKNVVTYKYSCSDPTFNPLAGTVRLIWHTIQDAIRDGASELDLGKSDLDTPGLIGFKDHWGALREPLIYYRYPAAKVRSTQSVVASAARRLLAAAPAPMFRAVGGLLYRHVG